MIDESSTKSRLETEGVTRLKERHTAELQRARMERDEALLRLLELEQEIAAHVCESESPREPQ